MPALPPLDELFAVGEQLGVEFKGPGKLTDKPLRLQVIRAVLGFANRRDGGFVIVGVDAAPGRFNPIGVNHADLPSWSSDFVGDAVAAFADPSVRHEVTVEHHDGKSFVVVNVHEFDDVPVLCRKSSGDVLHEGALYGRGRRKPETTEVRSQADMRDLLELAIEKRLRSFVATAERSHVRLVESSADDDRRMYDDQVSQL